MWNTIKTIIGYILLLLASVALVIFTIPIIIAIIMIIPPAAIFGLIIYFMCKE